MVELIPHTLVTWVSSINGFYMFPSVAYPSWEECDAALRWFIDPLQQLNGLCIPEAVFFQLRGF